MKIQGLNQGIKIEIESEKFLRFFEILHFFMNFLRHSQDFLGIFFFGGKGFSGKVRDFLM